MKGCLPPQDIERLITGTLPARQVAAAEKHLARCERCAAAVAEARANEAWLAELRDDRELAELRQRVADTGAPQTTATGLTDPPPDR